MRARFCYILFLFLLSILGVSSRSFAPNDGFAVNNQGTTQNQQPLKITRNTNEGMKKSMKRVEEAEARNMELSNKIGIGSRPPRCEHKCYGCMPCEAIQVPTSSSSSRVRVGFGVQVQYANYEPEGWKCKCGPTFYTP